MLVTDELCRCRDEGADGDRAERHEGEGGTRTSTAVVDHVHRQNPPHKLLPERGEPLPLGEHLRRHTQKARWRWRHLDLHFHTGNDDITTKPPMTHCAQSANSLRA